VIREISPTPGKVGLIINAAQSSEYKNMVKFTAQQSNISIFLAEVSKENEVSKALNSLQAQGVNTILMTFDPLVMNPQVFKYMTEFSVANSMRLITPSRALLKGGALASVEADYAAVGRRTAEIANEILRNAGGLGNLRLEFPTQEEVSINNKIAKLIQVDIPSSVIKRAVYIHQ
jgi:putative tryptophan/tyrosine transport system substrate-binding protein